MMKLGKLIEGLDIIEKNADTQIEITGVSYTSKQVAQGELFVAIDGFETDGHKYIHEAVEKGAAAVICSKIPEINTPYILTDNTRRALAAASANFFGNPAEKIKLIGVTGTNGKTTTTVLIKSIIEQATGAKVGLIGTNRHLIGDKIIASKHTTPESRDLQELLYKMTESGCAYAVMEVSSHALALDRVYGLEFEYGVFTNLSVEHMDFHGSMEEYMEAKALLFEQSKKGIINLDDKYAEEILARAKCPVMTFSTMKNEADLMAKDIRLKETGVEFVALTMDTIQRMRLGIPGEFSAYNALGAIAVGMELKIDPGDIAKALENTPGVMGRVEVVPTNTEYTMIIDYAHTPDALENILSAIDGFAKGRIITLFGCGGDRDRTKRSVMGRIAAELSDYVIVTSDNPRTEDPDRIIEDILDGVRDVKTPYEVIPDRREAIRFAMEQAKPRDIILLAGKGHETYQIFGKEKTHMDEREIIWEHLSN